MRPLIPLGLLAALVLPLSAPAAETAAQPASPPAQAAPSVEPAALALLKATGAALAAARSLSFTALAVHDVPSAEGQSVFYVGRSRVELRRPDRLRVVTDGDGPSRELILDGRSLTLFRPEARTVATMPAPASLDAALRAEVAAAGETQAFADVLLANPAQALTEGLTRAFVVGRSRLVGGVETDVVAFADRDAQAQIWIGVQDRLPRQLWVTETGAPGRPRDAVTFSDWVVDPPLEDRVFSTAHTEGAQAVPFPASAY
ncbi:DUF2092 domain-containing protein [Methylobacterium oxalidis]|uniref:DUF2092 domain-containing protein n=1 Tax=Methylobacterium oxalidis TaxID=944322 RepID=A0A512J5T7_9HYPH|nr:DUF2092 domain-containing protein [Methylobacterium oxalidis]GEP05341.1 hypothetical protein MOX02_33790 [Methylobacterium oxalidis]GJE31352.1 hypothetical protein LDDCCGHA_1529 [Methylobacterium oxalidis]GLS63520.1 hypothetical protein GCM10007888_19010 [Methylobacterium oxalidis]